MQDARKCLHCPANRGVPGWGIHRGFPTVLRLIYGRIFQIQLPLQVFCVSVRLGRLEFSSLFSELALGQGGPLEGAVGVRDDLDGRGFSRYGALTSQKRRFVGVELDFYIFLNLFATAGC